MTEVSEYILNVGEEVWALKLGGLGKAVRRDAIRAIFVAMAAACPEKELDAIRHQWGWASRNST